MPWYVTVYLVGAALPMAGVGAWTGYRIGRRGQEVDYPDEHVKISFWCGAGWPLIAVAAIVIAASVLLSRLVGHSVRLLTEDEES